MLERLDEVPWNTINGCYGHAGEIPNLIRALLSQDREDQQHTIGEIWDAVWHQGSIYEVSAYIVPFFLELLVEETIEEREGLLYLLQALADSSSYMDACRNIDYYRDQVTWMRSKSFAEDDIYVVDVTRKAILSGIPIYIKRLKDSNPAVRIISAGVLEGLFEQWKVVEKALLEHIATEPIAGVKSALIESLAKLWRESGSSTLDSLRYLLTWATSKDTPLVVRLAATLSLIESTGEVYIESLREILDESMVASLEQFQQSRFDLRFTVNAFIGSTLKKLPKIYIRWLFRWINYFEDEETSRFMWSVENFYKAWRFDPTPYFPVIFAMLQDKTESIRYYACTMLSELGAKYEIAFNELRKAKNDESERIRKRTKEAINLIEGMKTTTFLDIAYQSLVLFEPPIENLLDIVARELTKRGKNFDSVPKIIYTLAQTGDKDQNTLEVLHRALGYWSVNIRLMAAYAILHLAPQEKLSLVPVFIDAIRGSPFGLIAIDCLGNIGTAAQSALPRLYEVANSQKRFANILLDYKTIPLDEEFRYRAQRAIEQIETTTD